VCVVCVLTGFAGGHPSATDTCYIFILHEGLSHTQYWYMPGTGMHFQRHGTSVWKTTSIIIGITL